MDAGSSLKILLAECNVLPLSELLLVLTHRISIAGSTRTLTVGTMDIAGQVTYGEPEVSDLSKPSDSMGKSLTGAQYAFTLEPYVNGTPAPTLVTKEVDMAVAAPFLLVNPDF